MHPKMDFVYFIQRKNNTFIYICSDISVIVVVFVLMIISNLLEPRVFFF